MSACLRIYIHIYEISLFELSIEYIHMNIYIPQADRRKDGHEHPGLGRPSQGAQTDGKTPLCSLRCGKAHECMRKACEKQLHMTNRNDDERSNVSDSRGLNRLGRNESHDTRHVDRRKK